MKKPLKIVLGLCFLLLPVLVFSQDTLNHVDAVSGKKYGWWRVYGNEKPWIGKGYDATKVAEEGKFTDGKKTGKWTVYYPGGKIKSTVEFKNGRPLGFFRNFYENGCIEEEGEWRNNTFVNELKRYAEDSCGKVVQKKVFDKDGKTGTTQGTIIRQHDYNTKIDMTFIDEKLVAERTRANQEDSSGIADGHHSVLDDRQRLFKDGEFKDGRLWNGKKYVYDKNGIILRVEVYKESKYIRDGKLE